MTHMADCLCCKLFFLNKDLVSKFYIDLNIKHIELTCNEIRCVNENVIATGAKIT